MSGTFPPGIRVASESIESVNLTFVGRSLSGHRTAIQQPGHLWKIRIQTPLLNREKQQALHAFLVRQKGRHETFTYTLRSARGIPLGSVSGSPQVNGAHSAGATSVAVDGLPVGQKVFRAGDFIKFENHKKVYLVQEDVTSEGSGAASISTFPELFGALSDNESLIYSGVPFTVALASDATPLDIGVVGYAMFDIEMEEQFN